MPRKKEEQKIVKYYMPDRSKEIIDHLVDNCHDYKVKSLWKQKYYHLAEYIATQNFINELDVNKDYVNINAETMANVLSVDNAQMATILKNAVDNELLRKDGKMRPALKARRGNKTVYIQEGKSYGYQFKNWHKYVEVEIIGNKRIHEKMVANLWEKSGRYLPGLPEYRNVLSLISIDEQNLNMLIEKVLINKKAKSSRKEKYDKFMKCIEYEFCINNNKHDSSMCIIIPFAGVIVPARNSVIQEINTPLPENNNVTCEPRRFTTTTYRKRKKKVADVVEEPEQTTIARVKRSVYIINSGYMLPSRPDPQSRVYCEVTHLNRELRKAIRLDGKKIIGIDIANCQPLIASILMRNYWLNETGQLPDDVIQYQRDCEAGMFYNNFMKAIGLPEDDGLRTEFKVSFFSKVFFSKVIEKNNVLKELFMKKYPSCWEAICDQKGGLYCKDYKEFAKMLQRVEAVIIFDTVNMGLIKQGIKAFNIFDSIYVNNSKDLEVAKRLIMEAFKDAGVTPTLKTEYKEHIAEND